MENPKYKKGEWITSFYFPAKGEKIERYKVVGIKAESTMYFYLLECPQCKGKFEVNDTHAFFPSCRCFPKRKEENGMISAHVFQAI